MTISALEPRFKMMQATIKTKAIDRLVEKAEMKIPLRDAFWA